MVFPTCALCFYYNHENDIEPSVDILLSKLNISLVVSPWKVIGPAVDVGFYLGKIIVFHGITFSKKIVNFCFRRNIGDISATFWTFIVQVAAKFCKLGEKVRRILWYLTKYSRKLLFQWDKNSHKLFIFKNLQTNFPSSVINIISHFHCPLFFLSKTAKLKNFSCRARVQQKYTFCIQIESFQMYTNAVKFSLRTTFDFVPLQVNTLQSSANMPKI